MAHKKRWQKQKYPNLMRQYISSSELHLRAIVAKQSRTINYYRRELINIQYYRLKCENTIIELTRQLQSAMDKLNNQKRL